MTTKISDLPVNHDPECRRLLPYGAPGRTWSLDPENCHRCIGLVGLLDAARDRRLAVKEELKRKIISHLDALPHGARGPSQTELLQYVEGPETGKRIRLTPALRELRDDRIIAEHAIQGVLRYTIKGR